MGKNNDNRVRLKPLGFVLLLIAALFTSVVNLPEAEAIGNTITLSSNSGPVAGGGSLTISGTEFGTRTDIPEGGSALVYCTLANNQIYCRGNNVRGALGNGTTITSNIWTPTLAGDIPVGATISDVVLGYGSACALADGWVYCWGLNSYGQLGQGVIGSLDDPSTYVLEPKAIVRGAIPAGVTITSIESKYYHVCGTGSDNKLYCWGEGGRGQLGNNVLGDSGSPVAVLQGALPANYSIKQISTGWIATCVIANDDRAYCWGYNTQGFIGNGATSSYQMTPAKVVTKSEDANSDIPAGVTFSSIETVAASSGSTCAIASNNLAYCWGNNINGSLGNNSAIGANTPQPYPKAVLRGGLSAIPASATFVDISVARGAVCAIMSDDNTYCWGLNDRGQLGDGMSNDSGVAVKNNLLGLPNGVTAAEVKGDYYGWCVKGSDGPNYCATNNTFTMLNDIADVTFDGVQCFTPNAILTTITDTSISSCSIPAHAPGPVNVVVTDVFGATATAVYTYYDVPSAPLNLAATPGANTTIGLTWQAPATDNYSAITDYTVQYYDDDLSTWTTVSGCTGTTRSCDVTGLSNDELHQFRVAAINAAGQGPWSNVVTSAALFLTVSTNTPNVNVDSDLLVGRMSSAAGIINVKTNNADGYSLMITATNTNMAQASNSYWIPTLGAVGSLVGGTAGWGWRAGGIAENGVSGSQYSDWKPMQNNTANPGALIDQTNTPNATLPSDAGTNYNILFGVAAGTTQASGTYSTTVTYTTVAN